MVNTAKVTGEFPLSGMASAAKEALGKAMRSSSLSIALGAVACIMLWAWIITGTHPVRAIVPAYRTLGRDRIIELVKQGKNEREIKEIAKIAKKKHKK